MLAGKEERVSVVFAANDAVTVFGGFRLAGELDMLSLAGGNNKRRVGANFEDHFVFNPNFIAFIAFFAKSLPGAREGEKVEKERNTHLWSSYLPE